MIKNSRFFLIFIILAALPGLYTGCKTNKSFDIRGVWDFSELRDDNVSWYHHTVILEGSPISGSVESYPVKDGYWRGTYRVDIKQVIIQISYGRGPAYYCFDYQGSVIYDKLVTGSMEGYYSLGGVVYHTWRGIWQLSRD